MNSEVLQKVPDGSVQRVPIRTGKPKVKQKSGRRVHAEASPDHQESRAIQSPSTSRSTPIGVHSKPNADCQQTEPSRKVDRSDVWRAWAIDDVDFKVRTGAMSDYEPNRRTHYNLKPDPEPESEPNRSQITSPEAKVSILMPKIEPDSEKGLSRAQSERATTEQPSEGRRWAAARRADPKPLNQCLEHSRWREERQIRSNVTDGHQTSVQTSRCRAYFRTDATVHRLNSPEPTETAESESERERPANGRPSFRDGVTDRHLAREQISSSSWPPETEASELPERLHPTAAETPPNDQQTRNRFALPEESAKTASQKIEGEPVPNKKAVPSGQMKNRMSQQIGQLSGQRESRLSTVGRLKHSECNRTKIQYLNVFRDGDGRQPRMTSEYINWTPSRMSTIQNLIEFCLLSSFLDWFFVFSEFHFCSNSIRRHPSYHPNIASVSPELKHPNFRFCFVHRCTRQCSDHRLVIRFDQLVFRASAQIVPSIRPVVIVRLRLIY